jgi:hypothetical protein
MNLTEEKLLQLGWVSDNFKGFSFMRKDKLALIPMAGVWALGHLIFGQPHIPFGQPPFYISTEEDYNREMSEISKK